MLGATDANDFPRHANGFGQADGGHASLRTDLDDAERRTGIYGSEGWGFESLRARTCVVSRHRSQVSRVIVHTLGAWGW
jgi:hypothetical protein